MFIYYGEKEDSRHLKKTNPKIESNISKLYKTYLNFINQITQLMCVIIIHK